ncbi:hypothetical protein ABT009_35655 [Streptomyces sp. NPDC002896]|uniref:hypothetical protein n=1 Tax=Streptomyces sp. NPDC002896 TaxID=3154438 RepID=UPI003319C2B1
MSEQFQTQGQAQPQAQWPAQAQPQPQPQPQPHAQWPAQAPAPAPPIPPLPPTAGYPEDPAARPKKDRRVLRTVLRWTAAAVVFAAVGTSAAYGITQMKRTDVPGLATESDGRWEYPEIVRPPLPDGSPGPFDDANTAGAHYADLRALVLPAPKGAKADAALRGEDGWLATKTLLAEYDDKEDRKTVGQLFTDHGLRHIAARGWTTPDGTHTRIYLLQFNTAAVVDTIREDFFGYDSPTYELRGATEVQHDEKFPQAGTQSDVGRYPYDEAKPYGAEQTRQAYITAGDVLGLVVQSRKGKAAAVPFQQTVVLQSQLLG